MKQIGVRLFLCLIVIFILTGFNLPASASPAGSGISDLSDWSPSSGCIALEDNLAKPLPDSEFDIIIQASNYQALRSGLATSLYLGSGEDIDSMYSNIVFESSILYGALFIVFAFSIMMAILRKDIKYSLFLAIICISVFFAIDLTGINMISRLIPSLDISNARVLLYSSIFWCVLSATAYWYFQFKSNFYNTVLKLVIFLSVCWQLLVIIVPIKLFEAFIYALPKINFVAVYAVIIGFLNIAGIIKGTRDNYICGMEQLLCVSIFTVSALLDYSYYNGSSRFLTFPILPYALIFILAVQMIIQAKQVQGLLEQQRNDELRFVQAQIKPYLLYSVINTYITTSQQDSDKARTILESFAAYLRKTFDIKKSYQYYSLREAISLIQSYISIEQIRLDNALEVNYELPENLDVAIPTCMLQPIVENSVVHGLRSKERGGHININIKQRGGYMYFSVKDNGIGMTPKEITNALNSTSSNSLSNIADRLSLFNRKVLSISSSPNEGTEVSWRVRIKELKDLC